jgi:hypothetical protein
MSFRFIGVTRSLQDLQRHDGRLELCHLKGMCGNKLPCGDYRKEKVAGGVCCSLGTKLIISVFIGEFKFGITPRDSTIRQVNKRDFILVRLFGVLGWLVC